MRECWIGWSVLMLLVWLVILLVAVSPRDGNPPLVLLACLSLAHIAVSVHAAVNGWFQPTTASKDQLTLAREAVASLDRRRDEDVNEWARRIAADVASNPKKEDVDGQRTD